MASAGIGEGDATKETEMTCSSFILDGVDEPPIARKDVGSDDIPLDGKTTGPEAISGGGEAAVLMPTKNDVEVNVENDGSSSSLFKAAKSGDEALVRLLIERGADVNAKDRYGNTVLHNATCNKSTVVCQLLIKEGVDINAKNNSNITPLYDAASWRDESIVRLLIEEGADVNVKTSDGETVLQKITRSGSAAVVRLLIKRGADVNIRDSDGNTILHEAAKRMDEAIARLIIEQSTDVNAKNSSGRTVLHEAARHGREAVVELLVKKGADVNARDSDGNTVLHEAAERNRSCLPPLIFEEAANVARLLVEKGADVTAKNSDGDTILHTAARSGSEAIFQLLIEKGADLNAKNSRNNIVLHEAAAGGSEAICQLLIEKGAHTNARNDNNKLPVQLAVEGRSSSNFKVLWQISNTTLLNHDEVGDLIDTALRTRAPDHKAYSSPLRLLPKSMPKLRAERRRSRLKYLRELKERMGLVPIQDEPAQLASHFASNSSRQLTHDSERSRNLCDYCRQIPLMMLLQHPERDYTFRGDFAELRKSADSCVLCAMILSSVRQYQHKSIRAISLIVTPEFLLVEALSDDPDTYGILRLCAESGSKAADLGIHVSLPFSLAPESQLYFPLLRSWLETCNECHYDHGPDSNREKKLPTRVLDLGDSTTSEILRLYITGEQEMGKYIALSHCWGDKTFEILTKDTLKEFQNKIDFDRLPQTFRDAVAVTKALGIRYLWIDSYCIIQKGDDMSDWETESQYMEEYFTSAYCTIAATSATGPGEGFLAPRLQSQSVSILDAKNKGFEVHVSEIGENFAQDVEMGVLNTRAWVLQERALSCRTIHFTSRRTYWECESVVRCDNLLQMINSQNPLASSNFPSIIQHQSQNSFAYEYTFAMYSKLALSKINDRPRAISGLVKRLEKHYKSKITSGIVHRYLHQSLLWKRAHDERMRPIDESCANSVPSWSWLSLEGEIRYDTQCLRSINWSQDLVIRSTPSEQHLEAPVYSLGVNMIERYQNSDCRLRDTDRRLVGWARFDQEDAVSPTGVSCIVIGKHRYAKHGWAMFGEEADTWEKFAGFSRLQNMAPGDYYYVLLLRNSDGQQLRQYSRIGIGVVLTAYLRPVGGRSQIV